MSTTPSPAAATPSSDHDGHSHEHGHEAQLIPVEPVEVPKKAKAVEFPPLQSLNFLYLNLSEAQRVKGKFTLTDSKNILVSKQLLTNFLERRAKFDRHTSGVEEKKEKGKEEALAEENPEDKKEVFADQVVFQAFNIIVQGTEVMQSTGIFTIEGAAELLDSLQTLENYLSSIKSNEMKMADKKAQKKAQKNKGKK